MQRATITASHTPSDTAARSSPPAPSSHPATTQHRRGTNSARGLTIPTPPDWNAGGDHRNARAISPPPRCASGAAPTRRADKIRTNPQSTNTNDGRAHNHKTTQRRRGSPKPQHTIQAHTPERGHYHVNSGKDDTLLHHHRRRSHTRGPQHQPIQRRAGNCS